ncbi:Uncharacterized protein TCM_002043 [Theobroma cacao]|uniref:CCHC-type domain-containing protein n=1 Tax=Theobroma cacao TaxID=3641 RepID=A0A061DKM9_THECC|nr:Uncharacterized protein TCM_002043 [Theobroma cacao]
MRLESTDVMDDIHSKRTFRLSEEEACPLQIKLNVGARSTRRGKELCLGQLTVNVIEDNKFLFAFSLKGDYDRVIKGNPWCFDRSLLVLKEFEEDLMDPEEIKFMKEELWIQVTGILLKLMTGETTKAIVNLVGQYVHVDSEKVCDKNQVKWINIQYERLPRFCYRCRVLGHNEKDCCIPCFDEKEHDVNSSCKKKSRADNVLLDQSRFQQARCMFTTKTLNEILNVESKVAESSNENSGPMGGLRDGVQNDKSLEPMEESVRQMDSERWNRLNRKRKAMGSKEKRKRSGGLAMLWNKGTLLTVKSFSLHHIDTEIMLKGDVWRMTGFYGYPNNSERALGWSFLQTLKTQAQCPWVCLGDFNEIFYDNEKSSGADRSVSQMKAFREACED